MQSCPSPQASIPSLRRLIHLFVRAESSVTLTKALLWNLLHEDPECPTRALLDKVAQSQVTDGGERSSSQSATGKVAPE